MSLTRLFALSLVLVLGLAGSAHAGLFGPKKRAFTSDDRAYYASRNIELSRVQMYLSDSIELKRQVGASQQIDDNNKGRFVLEDGKTYEFYSFRKGLSGVAEVEDGDVVKVRFEAGPERMLTFSLTPLSESETLRFYRLQVTDGTTTFAGHTWEVISGQFTQLEFSDKRKEKTKKDKKKAKGYKVRG